MSTAKVHSAIELHFPAALGRDEQASSAAIEARVLSLFDECGPGLRRYVTSFGLSVTATEDIVQDVFLALFRHLTRRGPETNLKGWVFRVAHNLALKHRQNAVKRQQMEASWDATIVERVADRASGPEQQLAEARRRHRLLDVLQQMPERERQCIHLRAEGLCYRDIAGALGISLGSVAKSLVRGVARLASADRE